MTPYLLETLYWAVVSFPVWGSCTVARLNYSSSRRHEDMEEEENRRGGNKRGKRTIKHDTEGGEVE